METARGLLLANQKRYALVIGAEQMSSVLDMTIETPVCSSATARARPSSSFARTRRMNTSSGVRGDTLIRVGGPLRAQHMTMDGQAVSASP